MTKTNNQILFSILCLLIKQTTKKYIEKKNIFYITTDFLNFQFQRRLKLLVFVCDNI